MMNQPLIYYYAMTSGCKDSNYESSTLGITLNLILLSYVIYLAFKF